MSMSQELFVQLSTEYRETLFRSAFRKLKNKEDAEDITQSTYLKAFKYRDAFRFESSFGSWIYRIMLNEVGMFFRARSCGRWDTDLESPLDTALTETLIGDRLFRPDVLFASKEIRLKFEEVLDTLSEKQKDVALLRYGLGMSVKEIAEQLDRTEGGVKSSLFHARHALRSEMVEV